MAESDDTKPAKAKAKKDAEPEVEEVPVADRLTDLDPDPAQTKSPVYGD